MNFKIGLLLLLLGTTNVLVWAQDTEQYTLPALTDIAKVSWRKNIYRFPEFQNGKITYTKGFELDYALNLNYNIYYEKMDFINADGDTLSITNTREIKSVKVGDNLFFHNHRSGFYEVLLQLQVALAFRNQFVLEKAEYSEGQQGSISGSDARGAATNYGRVYGRVFTYFFIDQKNELHKANKASILRLFPDHHTEIKRYLLEHQVDFASREDLIELTQYCNQF